MSSGPHFPFHGCLSWRTGRRINPLRENAKVLLLADAKKLDASFDRRYLIRRRNRAEISRGKFANNRDTPTSHDAYIKAMAVDWQLFREANAKARMVNPTYYWFHTYDGTPRHLWDEVEVSEAQFRANTDREAVASVSA